MEVDYPVVNEEACHRVKDSFVRMDDECDQSLLVNNEDSEKATRQWEDTFDKKGTEFVKEYYTYDDVKKDVRKITVREVETLLRELGYSQSLEIIVR